MDLAWSATDSAFRDDVRAFLQQKLTPELRQAGRLMTSVYADHEASMADHLSSDTQKEDADRQKEVTQLLGWI